VKDDIANNSLTSTYSAVSPAEGSYDLKIPADESARVSDPVRIRVRPGYEWVCGSGLEISFQAGKNQPQKVEEFHVLKCWLFSLKH